MRLTRRPTGDHLAAARPERSDEHWTPPPPPPRSLADLPVAAAAPIQGMFAMGFDGMAALDEDDDSASEQEDELNLDHLDFKEVTSSDFRTNHVMGSGDLVGHAMAVAARRGIPVSTTVQFLQDDRDKLVDEIKSKIRIVNGRDDDPPNSLQNQQTSWEMLYVEVRPKKKGGHDLSEADFGKVRYAAQGYEMGHGRRGYEVNHLEGMT